MNNTLNKWPEWPQYSKKTIENLKDVVVSNRWAISGYWTGKECNERIFAKEFATFNEVPYCVPTTSGTNALLIALESLGIGYGDEVIVPALTWLATASVVLNVNAKPILVDVDPETYCIDPNAIEKVITQKTKAIIPVHLYGSVADMGRIMEIADRYNLFVIEDCAQSHGSTWEQQKVGTIGDVGCFSFQQAKVLTAGEGGAVITKDKEIYKRLEQLRADGRILSNQSDANFGSLQLFEVGDIQGSNHCISEFQSSILIEQLKQLDHLNRVREDTAKYIENRLLNVPGVSLQKRSESVTRQTYYSFVIKIADNYGYKRPKEIIDILKETINMGDFYIHSPYPAVHLNKLFCPWTKRRYPIDIAMTKEYWRSLKFPVAERAVDEAIVLHHSILLAKRDLIDYFIDNFINTLKAPKVTI